MELAIKNIPIEEIKYDEEKYNNRNSISFTSVSEMADDIKDNGLISPLVVNEKYELRVGFRRLKCLKMLEWKLIPCIIESNKSKEEQMALNLRENIHRENLTMVEEAKGIKKFRDEGFSNKEVAEKLGKSVKWVQTRFVLLQMPVEAQRAVISGHVTANEISKILAQ